MKKAKEIFWSIFGFIFWIPWTLITFVFLPITTFAFSKSVGDSGFYGAKEATKEFAKQTYFRLLKGEVPEDED